MNLLLIVPVLAALTAAVALIRRRGATGLDEDEWPEVDIVVDLEFLRARPAELDQRISELVALSGEATLGARMRTMQAASAPHEPQPAPIRRRTRPLVVPR